MNAGKLAAMEVLGTNNERTDTHAKQERVSEPPSGGESSDDVAAIRTGSSPASRRDDSANLAALDGKGRIRGVGAQERTSQLDADSSSPLGTDTGCDPIPPVARCCTTATTGLLDSVCCSWGRCSYDVHCAQRHAGRFGSGVWMESDRRGRRGTTWPLDSDSEVHRDRHRDPRQRARPQLAALGRRRHRHDAPAVGLLAYTACGWIASELEAGLDSNQAHDHKKLRDPRCSMHATALAMRREKSLRCDEKRWKQTAVYDEPVTD